MHSQLIVAFTLVTTVSSASGQLVFSNAQHFNVGFRPEGIAAADFDDDGDIDLATAVDDPDRIRVLLRNGLSYGFGPTINLPSSASPQDLVAGDFDGDGAVDLAVAVRNPLGAVRVYSNSGNATFSLISTRTVGDHPRGLAAGDVDDDGDLDLAVANRDSDTGSVLHNDGDGTFSVVHFQTGVEPRGAAFGDIDGDGDFDLAVASHDERSVDVRENEGGDFGFLATLSTGSQARPEGVALADVDGNGLDDIVVARGDDVVAQNRVTVIRSLGDGDFAATSSFMTGGQQSSPLALADFDEDGDIDIAVANESASSVSLLRNTGNGAFSAAQLRAVGLHPDDIIAVDFDLDGDVDIVTANRDSNSISILRNGFSGGPVQPAPPTGLVAGNGTSIAHVLLSWNGAIGATEHQIWRQRVGDPNAQPLGTRPGTLEWYADTSAQPGSVYRYWVRSRFGSVWTAFSTPDTGFLASAPTAPASIVASDGTSTAHVLVTWTSSPGAIAYQVWRAPLGGAPAPRGLSTNGARWFTDTSAVPGVTYKYWVRARNLFGWGPFVGPELGRRGTP